MTERTVYEVCDLVEKAGRTLVLGHVNPDADCLGSAFALREMINSCGGRADVACDGQVPDRLSFMCDAVLTPDGADADGYDTIISVDVASPLQLGKFEALIPQIKVMIDHHASGTPFADNLIKTDASAAGEIVYRIYKELVFRGSIRRNVRVMRLLYAAIVSDCGSFKYSNTTPYTHGIAAELVANINTANDGGLDTDAICHLLFGRFTVREMTAKMIAIKNMRLYEDGRLGVVVFSGETLTENGLTESDVGNAVETPRCIDGVLVALALRQTDERTYKVSSRANAEIDCAAVCARYGGGGHVRAAGCTIEADSPEDAEKIAVGAFGEAVEEYLRNTTVSEQRI